MFNVTNTGIITITRGDSASVPLFINKGTEPSPLRFILGERDKVYLGVAEPNKKFENAVIRKVFTKDDLNEFGDVVIKFNEEDTVNLIPSKYFYQIKLEYYDKDQKRQVNTIVPNTEFYIEN